MIKNMHGFFFVCLSFGNISEMFLVRGIMKTSFCKKKAACLFINKRYSLNYLVISLLNLTCNFSYFFNDLLKKKFSAQSYTKAFSTLMALLIPVK